MSSVLSPGSKGWIFKYFDLLQRGDIVPDAAMFQQSDQYFKHLVFSRSGIIFGYPSEFLFARNINSAKWTTDEQLTLLLFECHLYVFLSNGGTIEERDRFILSLLDFYEHHSVLTLSKLFTFFLKESHDEKLEKILDRRTDAPKNLLESTVWVKFLKNTFVYLDVILYDEFLRTSKSIGVSNYERYAEQALYAICKAVYADGKVDQSEKNLFETFLASARMSDKRKQVIEHEFRPDLPITYLSSDGLGSALLRYFLLDISVLTIYANHEAAANEKRYLHDLQEYLKLNQEQLNETLLSVEQFVLRHNDEIAFLSNNSAVEHLYDSVSRKWVKILGRNKDKLALELKQSKELVQLIKKSTREELSKEEKEKVKTQFMDLIKSMPALAIFLLPGGALLLPIVLKVIPTLIPSAFRDNEVAD